ncbi:MAG: sugar transferase [Bacteroidota bacterium]
MSYSGSLSTAEQHAFTLHLFCCSTKAQPLLQLCEDLGLPYVFNSDIQEMMDELRQFLIDHPGEQPVILFDLRADQQFVLRNLRGQLLLDPLLTRVPLFVLTRTPSLAFQRLCRELRVTDYLLFAHAQEKLEQRFKTLAPLPPSPRSTIEDMQWGLPLWKRTIDILGAGGLLLVLSPLLLTIAVLIKLESRGPIFYVSKRAGQGFRVFNFIKFRSMRQDADQLVDSLQELNQYGTEAERAPIDELRSTSKDEIYTVLVEDDAYLYEEEMGEPEENGTFFKIKNDPRITRIGRFIRNTSLDELPQLFNVLRGDMSLVGNRPLPLYEAEQLTEDEAILRFAAPAGITGLWQVSKRGKGEMSEEERKALDITYAQQYNFWLDLEILWKTLPAAVQQENV